MVSRTAIDIVQRIRERRSTATASVASCLARIGEREAAVNAWTYVSPVATEKAQEIDARSKADKPLAGLPVGIKDIIDTADMPTAYGSPIYDGHRPARDAACVERLRAAGAVILGKTVTTEFGAYSAGKTRNPHDLERTPGGSSSGSAAAVADGMVPVALGTQTAGSVIRPASYNGVVGYKATTGLICHDGVKPFGPTFDSLGVFAGCVADAVFVARVIWSRTLEGNLRERPPRIGLCRTACWDRTEPETREALTQTVEAIVTAGGEVVEVTLPASFDPLPDLHQTANLFEAARCFAEDYAERRAMLSDLLVTFLEQGLAIDDDRYQAARADIEKASGQFPSVMQDCDAILTPAASGVAPLGLVSTGDPLFCRTWSALGAPAVCLPVPRSGLPVGAQLVGLVGRDADLLSTAEWVETALASAG